MNLKGTVIVDDKGSGRKPNRGLLRYLRGVAAKTGDIRLEFAYRGSWCDDRDDTWRMYAPRYLWRHNVHSPRAVSYADGARPIVKAGLVYKATVTKWNKRLAALRELPSRVRKLKGMDVIATQCGIYPNGTVHFGSPHGFVWKATGDDGYWKGYKPGEERKALKMLRGGLVKR